VNGVDLEYVKLYVERGSPKYENAALRWLERYLRESSPRVWPTPSRCASPLERILSDHRNNPVRCLHTTKEEGTDEADQFRS
jgi:hypothetical protein